MSTQRIQVRRKPIITQTSNIAAMNNHNNCGIHTRNVNIQYSKLLSPEESSSCMTILCI